MVRRDSAGGGRRSSARGLRPPVESRPARQRLGTAGSSRLLVLGVLQVAGLIRAASQLQEHSARTAALDHLDLFHRIGSPRDGRRLVPSPVRGGAVGSDPADGGFSPGVGLSLEAVRMCHLRRLSVSMGARVDRLLCRQRLEHRGHAERQPAAGSPPHRSPQPEAPMSKLTCWAWPVNMVSCCTALSIRRPRVDIPQHVTWNAFPERPHTTPCGVASCLPRPSRCRRSFHPGIPSPTRER